MGRVGALGAARLDQALITQEGEQGVAEEPFSLARDQPSPERAQDRGSKARILKRECEGLFPVQARPNGVGSLAVGATFAELQHAGEREAEGGLSRLTDLGEERGKVLVVVDHAEVVADEHVGIVAFGEGSAGDARGFFRNEIDDLRL